MNRQTINRGLTMADDVLGCPACGGGRFWGVSEWTQPVRLTRLEDGSILPEFDTVEHCVSSQTDAQGREILRCASCEREWAADLDDGLVVAETTETVEVDREALEVLVRLAADDPLSSDPDRLDTVDALDEAGLALQATGDE